LLTGGTELKIMVEMISKNVKALRRINTRRSILMPLADLSVSSTTLLFLKINCWG
jgi:hypothetical protein